MKVFVLIGVAGVGKSYWAKNKGLKIFSSDEYRLKLFGELSQSNNKLVFETLHKDIIEYILSEQKDFIYDATNLTRKNRIEFYNKMKKLNVEVECVHFLKNIDEIIKQNNQRIGLAKVDLDVIVRQYKTLQVAKIGLDCDYLSVVGKMYFNFNCLDFKQNNPYHKETVLEHIKNIQEHCVTEKELEIAKWHDVGKFDCRIENAKETPHALVFKNKNGVFYQYIHHANVSAQYYLSHIQDELNEENLNNLEHILLHDVELTEKVIKKYKLDDNFIEFHNRFRELDKIGAIPSEHLQQYLSIMQKTKNNTISDK